MQGLEDKRRRKKHLDMVDIVLAAKVNLNIQNLVVLYSEI